MKFRLTSILLLSITMPLTASAQTCSIIANDSDRLACYDAAASTTSSTDPGSCDIEDWKFGSFGNTGRTKVEGTTTCSSGKINFRFYDGETEEFLGTDFTYIEGFSFQTYADIGATPSRLSIKYTIVR